MAIENAEINGGFVPGWAEDDLGVSHPGYAQSISAAAPELLQALKTVLECWELGLKTSECISDYEAAKALIERLGG